MNCNSIVFLFSLICLFPRFNFAGPQQLEGGDRTAATKALLDALRNCSQVRVVVETIKQGADVNYFDGDVSMLGRAFLADCEEANFIVKALIRNKANVHARNSLGNTPLHIAVRSKALGGMEALLKAGADPNAKNNFGDTALQIAAILNRVEAAKLLLRSGADICVMRDFEFTNYQEEMKELVKRELEGSRSTDVNCWQNEVPESPSLPISKSLCEKQRMHALTTGCITNQQYADFKRKNRAPLCDVFNKYCAWHLCESEK